MILIDGYEGRCEAMNHLDRIKEVLAWLNYYGVLGDK